jgi:hypothetical protein
MTKRKSCTASTPGGTILKIEDLKEMSNGKWLKWKLTLQRPQTYEWSRKASVTLQACHGQTFSLYIKKKINSSLLSRNVMLAFYLT